MFGNLDASIFSGSESFYDNEFKEILSKITICFQLIKAKRKILQNNENKIRDHFLLNYLKNDKRRETIGLLAWQFEREVQEDHSAGRTDIKVLSLNTFKKQEAYYILECKRLDNVNTLGTTGLNAEYIKNGIYRFISKYYSSYYRVNGMLGFIVRDMEIDENVRDINCLLKKSFTSITTKQEITRDSFIEDFEYHYSSIHLDNDSDELKIYHLMFDLSEVVKD